MSQAAVALLCSVVVAAAAPPPEEGGRSERPCVPLAPSETLSVDFDGVSLRTVARLLSCAAGRNVMFSPAQLGDAVVTVVAPRPVTRRGLLTLWRALLTDRGLVSARHGKYDVVSAAP